MLRKVLVPIDDSRQSMAALEYALGEYPGGDITALHVIRSDRPGAHGDGGFFYTEEYLEQAQEQVNELLETAREKAAERGVEIETVLTRGAPARRINEFIDENEVDHVVIGSHGRSGASRILLGSVAEKVIRRSSVPVTVIR